VTRLWALVRRATSADLAIVGAALALVAALARPTLDARALEARVAGAIEDVDLVIASARASHASRSRWPQAAPAGEAPPELGALATDGPFSRADYSLAWTTWQVVDSVVASTEDAAPPAPGDAPRSPDEPRLAPATRALGALAVHTSDPTLRAALLAHYGRGSSFVLDTTWILVLPERAAVGP